MAFREEKAMTKSKKGKTVKVRYQKGTSNKVWDLKYRALKPGKRISKNGKVYWEYRTNRSDAKPETKL